MTDNLSVTIDASKLTDDHYMSNVLNKVKLDILHHLSQETNKSMIELVSQFAHDILMNNDCNGILSEYDITEEDIQSVSIQEGGDNVTESPSSVSAPTPAPSVVEQIDSSKNTGKVKKKLKISKSKLT